MSYGLGDADVPSAFNRALTTGTTGLPAICRTPTTAAPGCAYLNGLVEEYKNSIETADEFDVVSSNMDEAISKLLFARQAYQSMTKETLGSLVTEQNGPAVEVIDQNDKVVRLYNPKKVNFIKVTTEE